MAMAKFTVDTTNKLFIAKTGVTSFDAQIDLYSDGKEHWLVDDTANKFDFPIRTVAGDPIGGSQSISAFFFLRDGWKIRPDEADHTLTVDGNLFIDEGESGGLFVPTVGNFTVLITTVVSSKALTTAGSSAADVWTVPGSPTTPGTFGALLSDINSAVNSLAAAVIAADLIIAAGSTTTAIRTNAIQATGFYDGLICVIFNSAGTVARTITSYDNTNGTFNLDIATPFTPTNTDRFIVLGRVASAAASVDNNAVAIAVWARSVLAPSVGSYGELINKVNTKTGLIPALL